MQSNLYDALGVAPASDTSVLRAALRSVLRRFWATPRDASGDSEEAVRFVALAAAILTDPSNRAAYDDAAFSSKMKNPWGAVSRSNESADSAISLGLEVSVQLSRDTRRVEPSFLPTVSALARSLPESSNWAAAYVLTACAVSMILLIATVVWVSSGHFSVWVGLAIASFAVALSLVIAAQTRSEPLDQSAPSLSRLLIVKWRRESAIFMGSPPPQQDTAWIFRLRLMELTRSAAGFTTLENLGARALGRCADYSILALLVLPLLGLIEWLIPHSATMISGVRSVLLFPTLIVLLGVLWDAFWLSRYRITPGRWLVGAVVVSGVTETAYGNSPPGFGVLARRAWRYAVSAMSLGVIPVALWFARARWTRLKQSEGRWETEADSVVLTRPTPLAARAAAAALTITALTVIVNQWSTDMIVAKAWLGSGWTKLSQGVSDLGVEFKKSAAIEPIAAPLPRSAGKPVDTPAPAVPGPSKSLATPSPAQLAAADSAQARAAQARRLRLDAIAAKAARARQSGSYVGLEAECLRWTQDAPASAAAWRCLGLARYQTGAGRDALPALRQALKLEPNDADVEAAILRILRP